MQKKLIVTPSPYGRDKSVSTTRIMGDVVIALLPTLAAAVWIFGWQALKVSVICVLTAVVAEWAYQKLTHQRVTVGDLSAVVTGLILSFNLPATAPWWLCAMGSLLAIVLVKQIFGGLGSNFANPAMAARIILMLSWLGVMNTMASPNTGAFWGVAGVDTVASATPLAGARTNGMLDSYSLLQLFFGVVPGMMGETCKATLLLGGIYLMVRRVIDWRLPLTFIGGVFLLSLIKWGSLQAALYQILSGGLFLGAFFMATDYVTSPITKWGKVIGGLLAAVVLFAIRAAEKSSYPEGCSFAILFMNIVTPFIDRWTMPKTFGKEA